MIKACAWACDVEIHQVGDRRGERVAGGLKTSVGVAEKLQRPDAVEFRGKHFDVTGVRPLDNDADFDIKSGKLTIRGYSAFPFDDRRLF